MEESILKIHHTKYENVNQERSYFAIKIHMNCKEMESTTPILELTVSNAQCTKESEIAPFKRIQTRFPKYIF